MTLNKLKIYNLSKSRLIHTYIPDQFFSKNWSPLPHVKHCQNLEESLLSDVRKYTPPFRSPPLSLDFQNNCKVYHGFSKHWTHCLDVDSSKIVPSLLIETETKIFWLHFRKTEGFLLFLLFPFFSFFRFFYCFWITVRDWSIFWMSQVLDYL